MNKDFSKKLGGDKIIPSARLGIHEYRSHCLSRTRQNMVRYGIDLEDSVNPAAQGTDEVDNIMSKPLSPIPNIKRVVRNSYPKQAVTPDPSDSEQELLSDDEHNGEEKHCNYSTDVSRNKSYERSQNRSNYAFDQSTDQSFKESDKSYFYLIIALVVLIPAVSYVYFQKPETKHVYDLNSFRIDLQQLGRNYKINDDSILKVRSGIDTIYKNGDTGSFILFFNSNNNNFREDQFEYFVNNVAYIAAKYLRNETSEVQHLVIDYNKLLIHSSNEFIRTYKGVVSKNGVMLVKDLDKVSSELAMAFHYYCDEFNPLVKRSAVFFTLDKAKCSLSNDNGSPHAVIEKCLKQKWQKLPPDNVVPLLNRVVSTVVDLTSDF